MHPIHDCSGEALNENLVKEINARASRLHRQNSSRGGLSPMVPKSYFEENNSLWAGVFSGSAKIALLEISIGRAFCRLLGLHMASKPIIQAFCEID